MAYNSDTCLLALISSFTVAHGNLFHYHTQWDYTVSTLPLHDGTISLFFVNSTRLVFFVVAHDNGAQLQLQLQQQRSRSRMIHSFFLDDAAWDNKVSAASTVLTGATTTTLLVVLLISTRLVFIPLGPNSTMHRVASVRVQEGLRIFLLWSSFCCTKRENSMAFLYSDGCHTVGRAFCGWIVDLFT